MRDTTVSKRGICCVASCVITNITLHTAIGTKGCRSGCDCSGGGAGTDSGWVSHQMICWWKGGMREKERQRVSASGTPSPVVEDELGSRCATCSFTCDNPRRRAASRFSLSLAFSLSLSPSPSRAKLPVSSFEQRCERPSTTVSVCSAAVQARPDHFAGPDLVKPRPIRLPPSTRGPRLVSFSRSRRGRRHECAPFSLVFREGLWTS